MPYVITKLLHHDLLTYVLHTIANFVHRLYLFQEVNRFFRAKLEENFEFPGKDILWHIQSYYILKQSWVSRNIQWIINKNIPYAHTKISTGNVKQLMYCRRILLLMNKPFPFSHQTCLKVETKAPDRKQNISLLSHYNTTNLWDNQTNFRNRQCHTTPFF